MSHDASLSDTYASEVAEGHCTIIAALVLALDESRVLPRERYTHFLNDLWLAMPEEQAVGPAGAMVDRVLDLVAMGSSLGDPADDRFSQEDGVYEPISACASAWPEPAHSPALGREVALQETG